MDARMAPPSPSSAVSDLMQQLKSGEISKMQLFQQIAKLQGAPPAAGPPLASGATMAPSAPPPLPPPPPPSAPLSTKFRAALPSQAPSSTTTSLIFGGTATPSAAVHEPPPAVPFVSFNYSPSRGPAHSVSGVQPKYTNSAQGSSVALSSAMQPQPSVSASAPAFASLVSRIGAQPLPSDAEVLTSGVSHDKVQRLSVQEWMASKTRPPTASFASAPSTPFTASLFSTGGHTAQAPPTQTASAPLLSSAGPSLFSFLAPAPQPQSDYNPVSYTNADGRSAVRSAAPAALPPNATDALYGSAPQWGQSATQQGNNVDHHDSRYEDERNRGGGGEHFGGNEFLHFDPFRDDTHHRDDGPGASGGKAKGGGGGGGDEAKFHTRVTRWKSQKDAVREQMKQQLLQSELDECTFTPKVNPKSTKVVAKLRGRQRSGGGGGGAGGDVDNAGLTGAGAIAVSERLYQEADNYKAREELAARLKAEEEAELERECTFRPKINKNNPLTDKVKPKYMDITKRDAPVITPAAIEAAAKELEECTFVPQVNPISQEMVSAQLYLQQNIYERLSRPCVATTENSSGDGDGQAGDDGYIDRMDMMGSPRLHTQDDMYVRSRRRRGSALGGHHTQTRSTQRPRSAGGIVTDEEKAERAKQFQDFLERQKFHEQARRKKLEVTQQQLVPPHRPSINKKSQMMMENGRKGDFLERITKYAIRKEQDTVKNKTVRVSDPHCTFKPTINANSAKRNARSVTELSRGDLLRRETTQRLMKLKMEQEEMASLTFRPELSRASQRVEGRLKILTSPDTYLQRIQQQSQAHIIKQRRALQEKEMEEFSECTFKPRTIEAPAYVQRIARSVVLTKALKKQHEANAKVNQKPEWK